MPDAWDESYELGGQQAREPTRCCLLLLGSEAISRGRERERERERRESRYVKSANRTSAKEKRAMISVPASLLGGIGVQATCPDISTGWPDVFGPPIWWGLHVMAEHYPQRPSVGKKEECEKFVGGLASMLPCEACGDHFGQFLQEWAAKEGSMCAGRAPLRRFFCEAHNEVNAYNGKATRSCGPLSLSGQYSTLPMCVPQVPN